LNLRISSFDTFHRQSGSHISASRSAELMGISWLSLGLSSGIVWHDLKMTQ